MALVDITGRRGKQKRYEVDGKPRPKKQCCAESKFLSMREIGVGCTDDVLVPKVRKDADHDRLCCGSKRGTHTTPSPHEQIMQWFKSISGIRGW